MAKMYDYSQTVDEARIRLMYHNKQYFDISVILKDDYTYVNTDLEVLILFLHFGCTVKYISELY